MTRQKKYRLPFLYLVLAALLLAACGNNSSSQGPDVYDVDCQTSSLISAINQANNSPSPSVINLDYCIYSLTEVDNTISHQGLMLKNGLPLISSEITINGNSAVITIQPATTERDYGHFLINAMGDLELYDLELKYGHRPIGGAVVNLGGDFFASNVEFIDNKAEGDNASQPAQGGAIYNEGGRVRVINNSVFLSNEAGVPDAGTENQGGAIFNKNGSLTVANTNFTFNKSASDGGAIFSIKTAANTGGGLIIIESSEFEENEADYHGGAVALLNEIEGAHITNSLLDDNFSGISGGAIYSEDTDLSIVETDFHRNWADFGGAIFTKRSAEGVLSKLSVELFNLFNNVANLKGGGIFNENSDLTLVDGTLYGNKAKYCGGVQNGGSPEIDIRSPDWETAPRISSTSEIRNSYFHGNHAKLFSDFRNSGGGLCHLMGDLLIEESLFHGNSAWAYGGGLLVLADLELIDTQVSSNNAQNGGGMAVGGVLFDDEEYPGFNINIIGSTFESNLAIQDGNGYGGFGGGLMIYVGGTTDINRSSFVDNRAGSHGGGIYQGIGDLYLTNSTLSGNSALFGGGISVSGGSPMVVTGLNHVTVAFSNLSGISTYGQVNLSVYKSLFYGNTGDMHLSGYTSLNAAGNVIEHGPSSHGTILPAGSPMIGPLVGSIHPVLPGSPLIDFLSSCGEPDDQRKVLRPQGAGCEPGAYEYNGEEGAMADIPDIPQFEFDPEDSSDNCEPFAGLGSDVYTLGLPGATMNLPVVLRVEGEVPGWDPEIKSLSPLYQFSASLGDLQTGNCSPQGYADRLICMFRTPDHAPGMALDFSLFLNDCGDPVYTYPLVSIPQPTAVCQADLEEDECEAVGGAYLNLDDPYCLCP